MKKLFMFIGIVFLATFVLSCGSEDKPVPEPKLGKLALTSDAVGNKAEIGAVVTFTVKSGKDVINDAVILGPDGEALPEGKFTATEEGEFSFKATKDGYKDSNTVKIKVAAVVAEEKTLTLIADVTEAQLGDTVTFTVKADEDVITDANIVGDNGAVVTDGKFIPTVVGDFSFTAKKEGFKDSPAVVIKVAEAPNDKDAKGKIVYKSKDYPLTSGNFVLTVYKDNHNSIPLFTNPVDKNDTINYYSEWLMDLYNSSNSKDPNFNTFQMRFYVPAKKDPAKGYILQTPADVKNNEIIITGYNVKYKGVDITDKGAKYSLNFKSYIYNATEKKLDFEFSLFDDKSVEIFKVLYDGDIEEMKIFEYEKTSGRQEKFINENNDFLLTDEIRDFNKLNLLNK